jgi:mycothiol synthase
VSAPLAAIIIRPFTDDDYPALTALQNAIRPDRAETVESRRNLDDVLRRRCMAPARFVAELAGELVGYGVIVGHGEAQGADVGVIPAMRRQGIGSALWKRLETTLHERGATIVRTLWIVEADHGTTAFLEHHGFRERERAWDQMLDLATFNPSCFPDPTTALAAQRLTLTTLAAEGADDDSVLHQIHALHNACRADQPPAEDHREPIPFDGWVAQIVQGQWALSDALFLAKVGDEYVGMVQLWRSNLPDIVENGFTGVLSAYRNRGVARALKLASIIYARDQGYHEVRTGNHAMNGPMLRVNETLGFRKTAAKIRFEKKRDLAAD